MIPLDTDICVIGGGSGGLSVAAGAVQMGAGVVLFEGRKMGGDCLNYGCVPSKALIAAAKMAYHDPRHETMGVAASKSVNMPQVKAHIDDVIAGIAPHDSVERFTNLGVKVIEADGQFVSARIVEGGGYRVKAKYVVIATGSVPFVPPVPGLDKVQHYTNETIFTLEEVPEHLLVMGGGPIGIEMAQSFRRLGAKVTVLEAAKILNRDDPELVEILRRRLIDEGLNLREGMAASAVKKDGDGIAVTLSPLATDSENAPKEEVVKGSHLLVAVGRRPQLAHLGLEKAGIQFSPRGIETDRRLRTSARRVFAIGDVAGRQQFTISLAIMRGLFVICYSACRRGWMIAKCLG